MNKTSKIPVPTIERLALYSRPLENLLDNGVLVISSIKLADLCGVNPAQVRKDLAYFGEFGTRGVGYDVQDLLKEIKGILATDREWALCIVGIGNLGNALVENENFRRRGYKFLAAFDSDPKKVDRVLSCGLTIKPASRITQLVRELHIEIGVIATPPFEAQKVTNLLIDSGVKAILNFAPVQVRALEGCLVENVDFTVRLENLAYHIGELL
jgi:redox-sensing transcriptional repressor